VNVRRIHIVVCFIGVPSAAQAFTSSGSRCIAPFKSKTPWDSEGTNPSHDAASAVYLNALTIPVERRAEDAACLHETLCCISGIAMPYLLYNVIFVAHASILSRNLWYELYGVGWRGAACGAPA